MCKCHTAKRHAVGQAMPGCMLRILHPDRTALMHCHAGWLAGEAFPQLQELQLASNPIAGSLPNSALLAPGLAMANLELLNLSSMLLAGSIPTGSPPPLR